MAGDANPRASSHRALAEALALFLAWLVATWVFEGRINTLLRPEAMMDRLIYAFGVNVALGVSGGIILLRRWTVNGSVIPGTPGTQSPLRTVVAVVVGLLLGFGAYMLQGAPSTDPIVMINAFSQVFVVSAAEIVVCWCLVGATVERAFGQHGRVSTVSAVVIAAVLFGLYHFAHSPPFNTLAMVGLLSVVGLATSAFFFASRDLAGTLVFHNFLGMLGVVKVLAQANALHTLSSVRPPLIGTASLTAVVIAAGYWILRRATAANERR